jgi:hypothetical protein
MADRNSDGMNKGTNYQSKDNEGYLEETAAEVLPMPERERNINEKRETSPSVQETKAEEGRGIGMFALALSIISLFFLPVLLGAAGIIVGFISRKRGAQAFGNWAIGIGAASIVISLLFQPFF